MPNRTDKYKSPKKMSFPPKRGVVPMNCEVATRYSLFLTVHDDASNPKDGRVSVEWTTYGLTNSDGMLRYRCNCWYTCVIQNKTGKGMSVFLHDIGAQGQDDRIIMRITAKKWSVKPKYDPPSDAKRVPKGFLPIESNYTPGSQKDLYRLKFRGPMCFVECYAEKCCPTLEAAARTHIMEAEDGYPPPGSPGQLH